MMQQIFVNLKRTRKLPSRFKVGGLFFIALSTIPFAGCTELQQPKVEPFYAVSVPPPKQEIRWSNGKTPKSFDPARAAAAPETDIVRAAYEGLTDLDAKSLHEIPGVAERWESTQDLRTWTFHLRKDAHWSNGERVSANDFVRSWKRLSNLRDRAANSHLFQNILGMGAKGQPADKLEGEPTDFLQADPEARDDDGNQVETGIMPDSQPVEPAIIEGKKYSLPESDEKSGKAAPKTLEFGVEAVDEVTLSVRLDLPDKDFPKLVSNPIFRPVYGNGAGFDQVRLDPGTVTNGAFRITKISDDGITLERSDLYWNRKAVGLERVRFVPAKSSEAALTAYKNGEVDIVTNAAFEPLALKLLTPYEDFRRTAHNALNFYEFNTDKAPFNDRRVREALAISIDRAKLTDGDLEGTNQPAYAFFPLGVQRTETLSLDVKRAKLLLENAGYPDGTGFPTIRLVVNRNNTQQRVARAVSRMWKQNLNLSTDIIVKDSSEIDDIRVAGDFDLLRRGVVLPTNDELVNIGSVFGSAHSTIKMTPAEIAQNGDATIPLEKQMPLPNVGDRKGVGLAATESVPLTNSKNAGWIQTEDDAMFELRSIPLYYPTTYSLVKPYVQGFETNGLDAPSLKGVIVDNDWQPRLARGEQ